MSEPYKLLKSTYVESNQRSPTLCKGHPNNQEQLKQRTRLDNKPSGDQKKFLHRETVHPESDSAQAINSPS